MKHTFTCRSVRAQSAQPLTGTNSKCVTWLVPSAFLLLAACGSGTDFYGKAGTGTKDDKTPLSEDATGVQPSSSADTGQGGPTNGSDIGSGRPISALTWYWQCDQNPSAAPKSEGTEHLVIEGDGTHSIDASRFDTTPVTFEGNLCKPEQIPRDVVFVVDTSGSMETNDPRVGSNCGRLSAMTNVLSTLPANMANVGLITFNSTLDRYSSGLFDSGDALLKSLAAGGNVADVVCNAIGGTSYLEPLTKAQEILSKGRPNATKEIYFISDGEPNSRQGVDELAALLKSKGVLVGGKYIPVTIATVMAFGNDEVMKAMASRDSKGTPMHVYVDQISELTQALKDLTDNSIVGGELKYRPIGTSDYTTLNILDYVDSGFRFRLPSFTIDSKSAPRGLEVSYEYYDKYKNRYTSGGKLLWKVASGGN